MAWFYIDRHGVVRKFSQNWQGGIPQKREMIDNTGDLPVVICQTIRKSALIYAQFRQNICRSASASVFASLAFLLVVRMIRFVKSQHKMISCGKLVKTWPTKKSLKSWQTNAEAYSAHLIASFV